MFYCPGNSGSMYGKNIKFKEFSLEREKWITFICGSETKTVKTSLSAIRYINSPFYVQREYWLVFVKPKPFVLPPWGYESISHTPLLREYLFGDELGAFIDCFGNEYLFNGKISAARNAIDFMNANEVRDSRLKMAICNYILEKEWENIHLYKNQTVELPHLKVRTDHIYDIYRYSGKPSAASIKGILGDFYPVFKKNIHNSMYKLKAKSKNGVIRAMGTKETMTGNVFIFSCWSVHWPLACGGKRITLARPRPAVIAGTPWPFTGGDYKINGIDCHLEVLKARGGEFFKANLEFYKEKTETNFEFDPKNLISFIYTREAAITNGKTELTIARYVMNAEYESYVFNWLIDNDIFHYYKYK